MTKSRAKFQAGMLGAGISILLLVILGSSYCKSADTDEDNFSYRTIEIQGMTCIQWGHPVSYKGGLTCNWDEWKGKVHE